MTTPDREQSVGDLLSTAFEQFADLVRSEIQLARAEVTGKVVSAGVGAGMIAGGAILAIPALVLLLMAFAALLVSFGLAVGWADLLASVLGFAVCGALVMMGLGRLRADTLVPQRSIAQVKSDAVSMKEHIV